METTDIFIVSIALSFLEHHKIGIMQYIDFPDWLHSFSDIHWRSLHGLSWHDTSFPLNTGYTTTYFVYSPTEGHLNCFQSLEIMNKAAANNHLQIYVGSYIFTPGGTNGRQPTASSGNLGDVGSIHRLGISSGGGHGNRLQYSCLENPQGQRSLTDYSPWGCTESDMTEQLSTAHCINLPLSYSLSNSIYSFRITAFSPPVLCI